MIFEIFSVEVNKLVIDNSMLLVFLH